MRPISDLAAFHGPSRSEPLLRPGNTNCGGCGMSIALNMLSRILTGPSAAAVNERARRMATALEDEDLLRRVEYCVPGVPA